MELKTAKFVCSKEWFNLRTNTFKRFVTAITILSKLFISIYEIEVYINKYLNISLLRYPIPRYKFYFIYILRMFKVLVTL